CDSKAWLGLVHRDIRALQKQRGTFHRPVAPICRLRQVWPAIEEPTLHANSVALPRWNARRPGSESERSTLVQEHGSVELVGAQHADQPPHPKRPVMDAARTLWIPIHQDDLAHQFFIGENLSGLRARLGSHRYRPSNMTRQGTNVRQMPDHVANAGQKLDDQHAPV